MEVIVAVWKPQFTKYKSPLVFSSLFEWLLSLPNEDMKLLICYWFSQLVFV